MAKITQDKPESKKLQPFQMRVVAERDARTEEVGNLDKFIAGEAFTALDEKTQSLLQRQSDIMHQLVGVLNARIAIFEVSV